MFKKVGSPEKIIEKDKNKVAKFLKRMFHTKHKEKKESLNKINE